MGEKRRGPMTKVKAVQQAGLDSFMRMTCRSKWTKICEVLDPGDVCSDQPESPSFCSCKNGTLGTDASWCTASRSPYVRMCAILDFADKFRDAVVVDAAVCAEILNPSFSRRPLAISA